MGAIRTIIIYALIVFNAAAAMYMETHMASWYKLEIAVILFGMLASLILMIALAVDAEWSWPFSVLYFSTAIANNTFEFAVSKRYLAFLLVVLVNLFGFLISILSIVDRKQEECCEAAETAQEPQESLPVETYDVSQPTVTVEKKKGKSRKK